MLIDYRDIKKILLMPFFLLCLASVSLAQIPDDGDETFIMEELPQEQSQMEITYEDEIKNEELPENTLTSTKENYSDYKIQHAHRGSDGSYRLTLNLEGEDLFVFYGADGEFLRIEQDIEEESINNDWR